MAEIKKDLSVSLLLDFYGEMLTEKQREVVALYYNEDLSLAEIANISQITRQGVRDSIKRAEKQLIYCEDKLGLYERFHEIQKELEQIKVLAAQTREENKKLTDSQIINDNLSLIIDKIQKLYL